MRLFDVIWEMLDNALYVLHIAAILLVGLAAVACPLWLRLIHAEVVSIRERVQSLECSCGRDTCPVLPRVLPRLRRLGEEAD